MDNSTNTPHQAPKTKNAQKKSRKSGVLYLIGVALLATGGYFYGEKQGYFSGSGSDVVSSSPTPSNVTGLKLSINPQISTTNYSLENTDNSTSKKVVSVPKEIIRTEFTDISFTGNANVLITGKTVPSGRIRVNHGNSSETSQANDKGSWTTLLSRKTSGTDILTLEKETTKDSNKFVEVERVRLQLPNTSNVENGAKKAAESADRTVNSDDTTVASDMQDKQTDQNISFQRINDAGDEVLDVDKIKRTPVASPEVNTLEQTETADNDQPKSWQDRIQKGIESFFGQSKPSTEKAKENAKSAPQTLEEPGTEKAAIVPNTNIPDQNRENVEESAPGGGVFSLPEPTLPGQKPTPSNTKTPALRKVTEPRPKPVQAPSERGETGLINISQPGASPDDSENTASSPPSNLRAARQPKRKSRRKRFKRRASLRKKRFKRRSRSLRRRKARRRAKLRRRARYKRRRVVFRGRKRRSRTRIRQIRRAKRIRARRGETLWRYARIRYGNGRYYKRIARRNGIKNPHRIRVGQRIRFR